MGFSKTKLTILMGMALGTCSALAQQGGTQQQNQSGFSPPPGNIVGTGVPGNDENIPSPNRDPMRGAPLPKAPEGTEGFRFGSFIFLPEISLSRIYNDNVFAERNNEKRDWLTVISPAALLRSDWSKHKLEFWGGFDADYYDTYKSENVIDHWIEGRGRYDISANTNVYGGAGISKNHEDRSYPNRQYTNSEPTRFSETKGHAGIFHRFDSGATMRFGLTQERLDFNDAPSTTGSAVNMDDRDRAHTALGGRVSHKVSERFEPFLQGTTETRRYNVSRDDNGYQRDSDGYRVAAGFKFNIEPLIYGELYVGALRQNYKDSRLSDITAPDIGASLTWLLSADTRIKGTLDRFIEESTLPGVSASLDTVVSARLEHRYRHNTTFNARFNYTYSDFKGSDVSDPTNPFKRVDHSYGAGFGIKYDLNKYLYLAADYDYRRRSSNYWDYSVVNPLDRIAGNYVGNRVMFSIGTQWLTNQRWASRSTNEDAFFGSQDAKLGGLYGGIQLGGDSLSTHMLGPRGSSSITNEFAASSGTQGLFLGYGFTFNPWYIGIEADADTSDTGLQHKTTPTDRDFSVSKKKSLGLSLRSGYQVDNGSLLYVRFGKTWTTFESNYLQQDETTSATVFNESRELTLPGYRYGVGTEVPVSDSLFIRMDYTHTRYRSYEQNFDRFQNAENTVRVGLGWRPGAKAATKISEVNYNGFYVGTGIGSGTLETRRSALQQNGGGGLPVVTLDSDQGNDGLVYGLNAGIGYAFKQRWYVGLEVDVEPGRLNWEQERSADNNSRRIKMDRKSAYGLSARFGYVLANGTLLYGRVGTTAADYNVKYVKGASQANWLDFDTKRYGTSWGFGAEIPTSKSMYARLDWGRNSHDSINFVTSHGTYDSVTLDNKSTSFKIGLGLRF